MMPVPPVWVQVILAVVSLGQEAFKYFREKEENDKRKALEKVKDLKDAFKTARLEKNTHAIEEKFHDLKLDPKSLGPSKLSDKEGNA